MTLLLDTHALLWWLLDDRRVPHKALGAIESASAKVFFSPVNIYEIIFKAWLGKLDLAPPLASDLAGHLVSLGLTELPVSASHAAKAGSLDFAHRDPFDRLLIAQALSEDLALISNERLFDKSGVKRIWA